MAKVAELKCQVTFDDSKFMEGLKKVVEQFKAIEEAIKNLSPPELYVTLPDAPNDNEPGA